MTTVVELIATMLKREGIEYIFGIPGGMGSIDLLDAAEREGIQFVLTKHETAAVMMAGVYGELTGRHGVVSTAISPGLTNAANGLAYAYADRTPVVLFSDAYSPATTQMVLRQKLDTRQVCQAITKWSASLAPNWAHEMLQRAFRTAMEDRPGPVQLDIPDDVARAEVPDKPLLPACKQVMSRVYAQEPAGLSQVVDRIRDARAPAILAGIGLRWDDAFAQFQSFVERLGAPVFCTPKAKGSLPENHPYSAGIFIGGKLEMEILGKADLIITVGVDPGDMLAKPWKYRQPVICIDRVPNSSEIYHAESELVGNVAESLAMLTELLPADPKWSDAVCPAHRKRVRDALAMPTQGLAPYRVFEITRELTPEDVILTSDAGASKLILWQVWESHRPNGVLTPGPLGTMGFGVPSAIAAKLIFPSRPVVSICGDGGFAMRVSELETAMALGVAPVIVVANDRTLSQIKIKQEKKGLRAVGTTYPGADYAKVAQAYGGNGATVTTEAEFTQALQEALRSGVLTVIDARIDPSQYTAQFDVIREL